MNSPITIVEREILARAHGAISVAARCEGAPGYCRSRGNLDPCRRCLLLASIEAWLNDDADDRRDSQVPRP